MAQTKRKRRTKHRGNAAGVVEARGRTGRKPTASERGSKSRPDAAARREARLNKPPSWRSAINRALIAAAFLVVLTIVLFRRSVGSALVLLPFVLLIYVPLGYYTDLFMYRRRMRQKGSG
ncbi:MAG TPA: hypothetical protein VGY97_10565 [Solirubrobacteraceae bacterium]|jgi:hypothetical protein|nr:hypothetical protein [Solirubrobacteraceae bacterium]